MFTKEKTECCLVCRLVDLRLVRKRMWLHKVVAQMYSNYFDIRRHRYKGALVCGLNAFVVKSSTQ